jgi:hypothetical protein
MLAISFSWPTPGSCYWFSTPDFDREPVSVSDELTVHALKKELLTKWKLSGVLPGSLWLSFWNCEFHSKDRFLK